MEEKTFLTSISTVIAIVILAVISALIIGSMTSTDLLDCTNLSSSSSGNFTFETTTTLTPIGDGVSSSEVNANNQTWLEFDGVNDVVNFGNNSIFDFDNDTSFTLSAWVNMTNINGKNFIFSKGKSDNEYKYELRVRNDAISFILYKNGTVGDTYCNANDGTIPFSNNSRVFVVGRYEKDSGCFLYVDNILEGSDTSFDGIIRQNTVHNLTVGNRASEYFNGTIDDLKIYNYPLSNSQLSELYHKSSYGDQLQTIPVLMYHVIGDNSLNPETINETQFREQMDYLNSSGFETITDVEYFNWTQNNGFVMPEKPIIFIWDDEHISILVNASPIMAEYGYKGVAAIFTDGVGSGGTRMTWENITTIIETYDWSIASHSVDHCNLVTNCNTTENWTRQFSLSKSIINGNISISPITFIYPFNSWNSTTMDFCRLNYTMCFGGAPNFGSEEFIYKNSNLTNGELFRINVRNSTTISEYSSGLNFTIDNTIGEWRLNENNGTTAHDTSGNSNDGTLVGVPTWATDGILITLTAITDYTINPTTGLFTIVNNDYSWSQLLTSWTYVSGESCPAGVNPSEIGEDFGSFITGLLSFLGIMGVILGVLWLVMYVNKLFSKGGLNDLGQAA